MTATRPRLQAGVRRGQILDAAAGVFAERGYHEASMGEIARAAGIAAATIYDHFESKAELQTTLLRLNLDQLMDLVAQRTEAARDEPEAQLRAGVEAFFVFVQQHPYAWRVLFRDPPADPAVTAMHHQVAHGTTLGIAAIITAHLPPGLRDEPDFDRTVEIYAQLLKMGLNGLAAWWWDHREVPREVLVDRTMAFCWAGLREWVAP